MIAMHEWIVTTLICTAITIGLVALGFGALILAAMLGSAARADDQAQKRVCPDCPLNYTRCEYNPRTCRYGTNTSPKTDS